MSKKEEMKKVIDWCEKRKKEVGRIPILEINPFKDIEWLRNKTTIQIDQYFERADKRGIIYQSTTKSLWEYIAGHWKRIEEKEL